MRATLVAANLHLTSFAPKDISANEVAYAQALKTSRTPNRGQPRGPGREGGAADPANVRLVREGVSTIIDMRPLEIRPVVLDLRVQSGDWLHIPRAVRSERRDDISFYGSILSTLLTFVSLIVLVGQNK